MDSVVLMAFTDVRPIQKEDCSIHVVVDLHAPEPEVLHFEEVRFVAGYVTRALALDAVAIDAPPMKVRGKNLALVALRPLPPLVDHHAAMGVATTRLIRA